MLNIKFASKSPEKLPKHTSYVKNFLINQFCSNKNQDERVPEKYYGEDVFFKMEY